MTLHPVTQCAGCEADYVSFAPSVPLEDEVTSDESLDPQRE